MHVPSRPLRTPRSGLLAWLLLFGALAAAGGHGVFLFGALRAERDAEHRPEALAESSAESSQGVHPSASPGLPQLLREVGRGRVGAAALGWLLAAPALALVALALRRRLSSARLAWPLALAVAAITAGSYWHYLTQIVRPN